MLRVKVPSFSLSVDSLLWGRAISFSPIGSRSSIWILSSHLLKMGINHCISNEEVCTKEEEEVFEATAGRSSPCQDWWFSMRATALAYPVQDPGLAPQHDIKKKNPKSF